ncbi:MAG: hypothetical protein AAF471_08675 [Myxococcota bacterium]
MPATSAAAGSDVADCGAVAALRRAAAAAALAATVAEKSCTILQPGGV